MLYAAMNFPVRSVMSEMRSIKDLGFDMVELSMDPPKADHKTISAARSEIRSFLSDNDMGLICHMPTFTSLADLSATIREASVHDTLRSMEMAKELGAQKITLHPPYLQGLGKFVPDLVAGLSEKSLAVIHEQARELEIMVCVENMAPGSFAMGTPGQFREMLEAFPQFALTLDIGHTNLGPGSAARKAIDFIQEFPHKLGHIHVSDNFGKQDNHLPIGAGTIDYESVMKALVSSGYDESITLEIFSKDKEYLVTSRRKIQEMVGII